MVRSLGFLDQQGLLEFEEGLYHAFASHLRVDGAYVVLENGNGDVIDRIRLPTTGTYDAESQTMDFTR